MSWLWWLMMAGAQAGFLRLDGAPELRLTRHQDGIHVQGAYQIQNLGNEAALEVFPELEIDNQRWQGGARALLPGQKTRWSLDWNLGFSCHEKSAECPLALPSSGEFLLRIFKHYKDQNASGFAVPEVQILSLNSDHLGWNDLPLQLKIESFSSRQIRAGYTITNDTNKKIVLHLQPVLPAEFKLLSEIPLLEIAPRAEIQGQFEFENQRGTVGSEYVIYLTEQWREAGQRRGAMNYTSLKVKQDLGSKKWNRDFLFWAWWLWGALVASIGLWLFWLRPLRRLGS